MPFAAIIPVIAMVAGDALIATGAVVNCYALHRCGRSLPEGAAADIPALNMTSAKFRRQVGPCNVPQYNFDMCHEDLKHVTIQTSIPSNGVAQFDNVPPTCMVLSTVLTGGCGVSGPYPVVCGSACLQYQNLSDGDFAQLSQALAPYAH